MDACKKIYFYTPGQLLAAWGGLLAIGAATLASLVIFS